jgi:hypothetical protein
MSVHKLIFVMLNLFQSRTKFGTVSTGYETLKQVQGVSKCNLQTDIK